MLMEKNGLTAKALADRAGISVNTLNMYLGYREAMPAADVACKLARALDVTVEYLIEGTAPGSGRKRNAGFGIAASPSAAKKPPTDLSMRGLIIEEVKKTPKENLRALLELVLEFNRKRK